MNIEKQIESNKRVNLFFHDLEKVMNLDKDFVRELLELKKKQADLPDEEVEKITRKVLQIFYGINQYLNVTHKDIEDLKNIYRVTYAEAAETNIHEVMIEHHKQLSLWLSRFYPAQFIEQLKRQEEIGSVLNEEYTAEFQRTILDLDIPSLKEPILDIGCGSRGHLVTALNRQGKQAWGIDRVIHSSEKYFREQSWFEYKFEKESWGTIISHMSFSNHLLFTYRHDPEKLPEYLNTFKEILESLRIHGTFIYTPSIPFLENYLEGAGYTICSREIAEQINRSTIQRNW